MKYIFFYVIILLHVIVFSTDAMWIPLSGCNGKMDHLWVKYSETAHGCMGKKKNQLTFKRLLPFLYCTKAVVFKIVSTEFD